jgi:hypothetical protein
MTIFLDIASNYYFNNNMFRLILLKYAKENNIT